jgi:hypothetical protein
VLRPVQDLSSMKHAILAMRLLWENVKLLLDFAGASEESEEEEEQEARKRRKPNERKKTMKNKGGKKRKHESEDEEEESEETAGTRARSFRHASCQAP